MALNQTMGVCVCIQHTDYYIALQFEVKYVPFMHAFTQNEAISTEIGYRQLKVALIESWHFAICKSGTWARLFFQRKIQSR